MISLDYGTGGERGWPPGYGLAVLDEVDSTNEEARRRAESGEAGPLWIRAERQIAGRGRRGRTWVSGTGNLMCTLMMRPGAAAPQAARLSFAAALAVRELLAAYAPEADIRLKWPNDVMVAGAKAAGILLESSAGGGGEVEWLALGFGVNLAEAPRDLPVRTTALVRHLPRGSRLPAPEEALTVLAGAFHRWYERALLDFDTVRRAWLAHAHGLGAEARVERGGRTLTGRFDGIDADGALVLISQEGARHIVTAGEVFFSGIAGTTTTDDSHAVGD